MIIITYKYTSQPVKFNPLSLTLNMFERRGRWIRVNSQAFLVCLCSPCLRHLTSDAFSMPKLWSFEKIEKREATETVDGKKPANNRPLVGGWLWKTFVKTKSRQTSGQYLCVCLICCNEFLGFSGVHLPNLWGTTMLDNGEFNLGNISRCILWQGPCRLPRTLDQNVVGSQRSYPKHHL